MQKQRWGVCICRCSVHIINMSHQRPLVRINFHSVYSAFVCSPTPLFPLLLLWFSPLDMQNNQFRKRMTVDTGKHIYVQYYSLNQSISHYTAPVELQQTAGALGIYQLCNCISVKLNSAAKHELNRPLLVHVYSNMA